MFWEHNNSIEDMRPVNELRMLARWKLGGALAAVEREPEGGDRRTTTREVSSGFWKWTKEKLGLHPETVTEAQRIGTMPDDRETCSQENIKRRHMTASQRAMATAVIYPEPQQIGGPRKKGASFLGKDAPDSSLLVPGIRAE